MINIEPSSFRDRSGFIFQKDGKLYRQVNLAYIKQYRHLMDTGLYAELVKQRLIIPHQEVTLDGYDSNGGIVIQPKRVPFISYPYEWSFGQYKDAATAALKVHLNALKYGMILKDASAYNIQFLNGYALLIDTLSFEFYSEGSPWAAYGQFCRHFHAPLMLMCKVDVRMSKLMQAFIDGVPLDLASKLLQGHGGGLFARMHIHMHAKSIAAHGEEGKKANSAKQAVISKTAFTALAQSLHDGIERLNVKDIQTEWGDYYAHTNYTEYAAESKEGIVARFLQKCENLKTVWDLGANDGRYSRVATGLGANVVAFDIDPIAVERNWQGVKKTNDKMLPLILDLTAPSPAIGFANNERLTIGARQKPDVIMMLAVIHHMSISNNLPFGKIAEWLAELCRYLIIEFVPKEDSQVQLLLKTRTDIFDDYNERNFESTFGGLFVLAEKYSVEGSKRILYLMKHKGMV
jgi:hypothetical protein